MDEVKRRILKHAGASEILIEDLEARDKRYNELGVTDEVIKKTIDSSHPKNEGYYSRAINWFKDYIRNRK